VSARTTQSHESPWHDRLEQLCIHGLRLIDDTGWQCELTRYIEDLPYIEASFARIKALELFERMPVPVTALN